MDKAPTTDFMQAILGITRDHNTMLHTGLKHGEQAGLGKCVDEINRVLDASGVSGDYNKGLRDGLLMLRAYILAELRSKS